MRTTQVLGIPQRFAAASLKHGAQVLQGEGAFEGIPQRFAAASLKLEGFQLVPVELLEYSAAIRCGLIEAVRLPVFAMPSCRVFRSDSLRPH